MKQELSIQNLIGMGFMAFAMFLGAGNLIFPPMAGYLAGEDTWIAALGFLITGVGLPLMGIVTIARVGGGFNEITKELPPWLIGIMGSCIFLIIGPFYAVPRTALVAYEVGIQPFIDQSFLASKGEGIGRLLFCTSFFFIAWYFCLRPGKLLETVGKLITPALIILLFILGVSPLLMPVGEPGFAMAPYHDGPFINGFLEGYLTMDALAALMFGIVITTNLKSHGISSESALLRYSILTGIIAATGLALVYLSLFYLGATSREIVPTPDNGATILSLYAENFFGSTGSILLAGVVILACLTTAIGCITAAGEYFQNLSNNKFSYPMLVTAISLSCIFFANLGLNEIINLFIPVLFLLYPICILLILLGLIRHILPNPGFTYKTSLSVTFIFSTIDALKSLGHDSLNLYFESISFLPGYNNHMIWILPCMLCLIVSLLLGIARASLPSFRKD